MYLIKVIANFIYEKSILKSHSVASGQQEFTLDQLFGSLIPKQIYLVFLRSVSYVGNYNTNPFNFQHFKVSKITYDAENTSLKVLEPEWNHNNYSGVYLNLYRDISGDATSGPITFSDFKDGYSIFKIDVPESQYITRRGFSRLVVRFKDPLSENITAIIYGRFSARFTLSQDRVIDDEIII